jgi:hypothetical protein
MRSRHHPMKSPFSALKLVGIAIVFAGLLPNALAIMVQKLNGTALEVGYVSGTGGPCGSKTT